MITTHFVCILLARSLGALGAPAPMDTVRATQVAIVGEDSPNTPVLFGEISGFAFDRQGRLYVTDFKEKRVVVLDPSGKQLAIIGRSGQGPGEFEAPTGPAIGADGSLFVRNMAGVTRFSVDAATGIARKHDSTFSAFMYAPWRSKAASYIDSSGTFAFPRDSISSATRIAHRSYVRYTRSGNVVDTLRVPPYSTATSGTASYMVSANSGRMVRGLSRAPFEPEPAWTVTSRGTIISGDGVKYDLVETDRADRVVRRFVRNVPAEPVPARARADSAGALKRRIDSLPVPLDRMNGMTDAARKQQLPTVLPAYIGLLSTADGQLWVRRWATASDASVFDVFSRNAVYYRTVIVPKACATEPAPVVAAGRFACMVLDPDTGAESILLATVPK